jgi:hypothetical protein
LAKRGGQTLERHTIDVSQYEYRAFDYKTLGYGPADSMGGTCYHCTFPV